MATLMMPSTRNAVKPQPAQSANISQLSAIADTFVAKEPIIWIPPAISEDVPLDTQPMTETESVLSPLFLPDATLLSSCKAPTASALAMPDSILLLILEYALLAQPAALLVLVPTVAHLALQEQYFLEVCAQSLLTLVQQVNSDTITFA